MRVKVTSINIVSGYAIISATDVPDANAPANIPQSNYTLYRSHEQVYNREFEVDKVYSIAVMQDNPTVAPPPPTGDETGDDTDNSGTVEPSNNLSTPTEQQ